MIYSKVSCVVEKTLNDMDDLFKDNILDIDYFALVTATEREKITVDGNLNYSDLDQEKIISLLKENISEIYLSEDLIKYEFLDGGKIVDVVVVPVRAQDQYKVFSVFCVVDKRYTERDVTTMKFITRTTYNGVLLYNEVMKERNYFRNVFNSTDLAIICWDIDGKINVANNATIKIFGHSPRELIGNNYTILLTEEEKITAANRIKYVVENNKIINVQVLFTKYSKGERYVDLSYCPINNHQNKVEGIMLIARDITKLKIYEKQLDELKQFSILGELAAGVAHNIRNPLTSIRGCAKILQKKLSDQLGVDEFIIPIIESVDRIDDRIKQMLSYSMITEEKLSSLLDINEILEKCLDVMSFHQESKFINIDKQYSEGLPLIRGNNVKFQHAFLNILFNAVQAIESNGKITIKTCLLEEERRVLISISDNGKGIEDKDIHNIFKPGYTTKLGGTGFGLNIVKKNIEDNGGEIFVNSRLNEGTEFRVYLHY